MKIFLAVLALTLFGCDEPKQSFYKDDVKCVRVEVAEVQMKAAEKHHFWYVDAYSDVVAFRVVYILSGMVHPNDKAVGYYNERKLGPLVFSGEAYNEWRIANGYRTCEAVDQDKPDKRK